MGKRNKKERIGLDGKARGSRLFSVHNPHHFLSRLHSCTVLAYPVSLTKLRKCPSFLLLHLTTGAGRMKNLFISRTLSWSEWRECMWNEEMNFHSACISHALDLLAFRFLRYLRVCLSGGLLHLFTYSISSFALPSVSLPTCQIHERNVRSSPSFMGIFYRSPTFLPPQTAGHRPIRRALPYLRWRCRVFIPHLFLIHLANDGLSILNIPYLVLFSPL